MKTVKKLLAGLLLVTVIAISLSTVIETEAGKSVTVSFNIESSYGVDGHFTFSNRDMFESVEFSQESTLGGELSNDKVYIFGKESTTAVIKVDVKVVSTAKPGDKCEITFKYELAAADGAMSEWKTQSETVVIAEEIPNPPSSDAAVAAIAASAIIALGAVVIVKKAHKA